MKLKALKIALTVVTALILGLVLKVEDSIRSKLND